MALPTDSKERKTYPLYEGVLKYFPSALAAVAQVSFIGNEQHNPGQPLFDNREKSNDDLDCALRHIIDHQADPVDSDGLLHLAKAAWRVNRALQKFLEQRGSPRAPGARYPSEEQGRTCPNEIHARIAGDSALAQKAKNFYYLGLGLNQRVTTLTGRHAGVISEVATHGPEVLYRVIWDAEHHEDSWEAAKDLRLEEPPE